MTVGAMDLPPEGMLLGGVSLAGDAAQGVAPTDGLSLLFTASGITVQGPQEGAERLLEWSGLEAASCHEQVQLPDGSTATQLVLTAAGQTVRFTLQPSVVSPGQAAYLDQALPAWLSRYKSTGVAEEGEVTPPTEAAAPEPAAPEAAAPDVTAPEVTAAAAGAAVGAAAADAGPTASPFAPPTPSASPTPPPVAATTAAAASAAAPPAPAAPAPPAPAVAPPAPPAPPAPAPPATSAPPAPGTPEGGALLPPVGPGDALASEPQIDPVTGAAIWVDPLAETDAADKGKTGWRSERKSRKAKAAEAAAAAALAAEVAAYGGGAATPEAAAGSVAPPPAPPAADASIAPPPAAPAAPATPEAPAAPPAPETPAAPADQLGAQTPISPPPPPGDGSLPGSFVLGADGSEEALTSDAGAAKSSSTRTVVVLVVVLVVVIGVVLGVVLSKKNNSNSATSTTSPSTTSTSSPTTSSSTPVAADQALAVSINLRLSDLPSGWSQSVKSSAPPAPTAAQAQVNTQAIATFASCLGIPDATINALFNSNDQPDQTASAYSPVFAEVTNQNIAMQSATTIVKSAADAQQDALPFQKANFATCFGQFQTVEASAVTQGATVTVQPVSLSAPAGVSVYAYLSTVTEGSNSAILGNAFIIGGRIETTLQPSTNGPPVPSDAFNSAYTAIVGRVAAAVSK